MSAMACDHAGGMVELQTKQQPQDAARESAMSWSDSNEELKVTFSLISVLYIEPSFSPSLLLDSAEKAAQADIALHQRSS